jgi:hypothetical protein
MTFEVTRIWIYNMNSYFYPGHKTCRNWSKTRKWCTRWDKMATLTCLINKYSSVPNRHACKIINFGGKSLAYMTLFGPTRLLILKNFSLLHVYRVSHMYLDDFWKMGVASKWVKPHLQNFLCFLSIFIANFSEHLVAIASILLLSMALLCHISGGHK